MSASLVGSEMCIRDSFVAAPFRAARPAPSHGPSALQSASIRNPPFGACEIAAGVRTWNCAGPEITSKAVPEALE
eukprot:12390406-Alexandrium_andersonii.AAC.1